MNSYDDMPCDPRSCLKPALVLVLVAVLFLLFGCVGCAGGPPTFTADIRNPDGKVVMKVAGTVDDNKPWLERYAGPAGALVSGIGYALGVILSGGTLPPTTP